MCGHLSTGPTISFGIPGGATAPRHARGLTSSHLRDIDRTIALDVVFNECLRIAVTDPGCDLEPRLMTESPDGLGRHGLRLVEQLSASWEVGRDAVGATQVWCDLVLDPGRGRVDWQRV